MWKKLTKVLPLAFHESSMLPCEISKNNRDIFIKKYYRKVKRIDYKEKQQFLKDRQTNTFIRRLLANDIHTFDLHLSG